MERYYPGVEIAQTLPLDDWPKDHLLAICDFFESLRGYHEVMLGYAGVRQDLSFNLDVVTVWWARGLEDFILKGMDNTGRHLGFQKHKSSLIYASLDEIEALEVGLIKRGGFPFISLRSNGWMRINGAKEGR